MPTGYTYRIEENPDLTFRDFVLHCATAFGACIHQRDSVANNAPTHREVDQYYYDNVAKFAAESRRLSSLSSEQITAEFDSAREQIRSENRASIERHAQRGARYASMRAHVKAWEPPTREHDGLREFMLEQIDLSFPSDSRAYQQSLPSNAAEWHAERIAYTQRRVAIAAESLAEEKKRCREANEWIDALVASLG